MNLSRKSIIKILAFVSIVLMMSTLITAGAIACGAIVNSVETNPEQVDSDNLINPEQPNSEEANYDSLAECDSFADSDLSSGYGKSNCNSFADSASFADYEHEDSEESGNITDCNQTN